MSSSTHDKTQNPASSPPVRGRSDYLLRRRVALAPIEDSGLDLARHERRTVAGSPNRVAGHNLGWISLFPSTRVPIQPKFKVGEPNDIYEPEADRVADQVMRMPEPIVQRKPG